MRYPRREPYFAHRFVRVLHKSCAAQEIGTDACFLLCIIAHTEDSARYTGPVNFWNGQLMETMGFKSPKQLNESRRRAVEAGWLVYEREHDRSVGYYFVTIPERYDCLTDAPLDESNLFRMRNGNGASLSVCGTGSGTGKGREAEQEGDGKRKASLPIPIPSPGPTSTGASRPGESPCIPSESDGLAEPSEEGAVFDAWNEAAQRAGLTKARNLTGKRKAAARVRLKESAWRRDWREALQRIERSAFCRGGGDGGWKAELDWFLKPDTVTKVLEGKYDDRPANGNGRTTNGAVGNQSTARPHERDYAVLARTRTVGDGAHEPAIAAGCSSSNGAR